MLGVSQETPVAASDGVVFNPGDLGAGLFREQAASLLSPEMIRQHYL